MTGTVIRVLLNKGFAFVRGEDGVPRFMHCKDINPPEAFDTLLAGQRVEFTHDDAPKGPRAILVEAIPIDATLEEMGIKR
jgi:cold shock CspA family protein